MRIVQLNAGSLFEPGWPERRREVVAWLDDLDPDVVCLQEMWEDASEVNSAEWVVEQSCYDWHWRFGGYALPRQLHPDPMLRFGSAVLSRWAIEAAQCIPLPVNGDEPDHRLAGLQFELLHVRTAGVDVWSTHLEPATPHAYHRVRQVLFLDEAIRRDSDPIADMPPILCGDFNAEPASDEIRFLTSHAVVDGCSTYFQDAWAVVHGAQPGFTQDLCNQLYEPVNLPSKRIDYVFIGDPFRRPGGAGRIVGCELAFNEPRTGVLASDHFGLVVDVVWPGCPA